jgi:hypothetical protein
MMQPHMMAYGDLSQYTMQAAFAPMQNFAYYNPATNQLQSEYSDRESQRKTSMSFPTFNPQ